MARCLNTRSGALGPALALLLLLIPAAGGLTLVPAEEDEQSRASHHVAASWRKMSPPSHPSPRGWFAMAYDVQSDRIILFGGTQKNAVLSAETWAYDVDGDAWTNMRPAASPGARRDHSMVYDPRHDRVILYGGFMDGNVIKDDTWTYDFDNNTWTLVTASPKPPERYMHAAAFDSGSVRMVVFGGSSLTGGYKTWAETWTFDLENRSWKNATSGSGPSARTYHTMSYDARHDRIVLFGGNAGGNAADDGTWVYDNDAGGWEEKKPASRPEGRDRHSSAYDEAGNRVVVFGGYAGQKGRESNTTWALDLSAGVWENVTSTVGPPPRAAHSAAYDSKSAKLVLFSGALGWDYLDDTWSYGSSTPTPPFVISTDPPDGAAAVPTGANVSITFSGPMDRASAEASISSSTPAPGAFRWDTQAKTVTLDPAADLTSGTKYVVTVSASAKSVAGVAMKSPHVFSFTTSSSPAPRIVSTDPEDGANGVAVTASIEIGFSTAMDSQATEAALVSAPALTGSFAWNAAGTALTWDPSTDMAPDTVHELTVGTEAMSSGGVPLGSTHRFSFRTASTDVTPPTVLRAVPADGAVGVDAGATISITFSEPMDRASTTGAVSLRPAPPETGSWTFDSSGRTLTWKGKMAERTEYEVTVSTSAEDLAGNPMLLEHRFSFSTRGAGPAGGGVDQSAWLPMAVVFLSVAAAAAIAILGAIAWRRRRRRERIEADRERAYRAWNGGEGW
jgi:methionine-rich copper-binding protein CopC